MFKKFAALFCVSALAALTVYVYCLPVFSDYTGELDVYYMANSTKPVRVCTDELPLFNRCGESFKVKNGELSAEEILSRFNARIKFTEIIGEGVSYYAYSEKINREIIIKGEKINLHIFVGKTETTVGSPLIFGSF